MDAARRALLASGVLAGLVAACAPYPPRLPESDAQAPAEFPEAYYRQAAARGAPIFRVDPGSSLVVIVVRRGGALARLGHDHVVASHDVQGYIAPAAGRADLYVRLDRLVVDEPGLRAEAKLDTQPTEDDIAGTRRNMLNALQAAEHPFVLISIAKGGAGGAESGMDVAIRLHGITRTLSVPLRVDAGADRIAVAGTLSMRQSDFGIRPLSVLGGAIQVQDVVDLQFQIRARRI